MPKFITRGCQEIVMGGGEEDPGTKPGRDGSFEADAGVAEGLVDLLFVRNCRPLTLRGWGS